MTDLDQAIMRLIKEHSFESYYQNGMVYLVLPLYIGGHHVRDEHLPCRTIKETKINLGY